jgi:hypothetical protein
MIGRTRMGNPIMRYTLILALVVLGLDLRRENAAPEA